MICLANLISKVVKMKKIIWIYIENKINFRIRKEFIISTQKRKFKDELTKRLNFTINLLKHI